MVSSRKAAWLKEGVTMLIFGQGEPSGIFAGSGELAWVHGQPLFSTEGNSFKSDII